VEISGHPRSEYGGAVAARPTDTPSRSASRNEGRGGPGFGLDSSELVASAPSSNRRTLLGHLGARLVFRGRLQRRRSNHCPRGDRRRRAFRCGWRFGARLSL